METPDPIAFCIAQTAHHARQLTGPQAVLYLQGFLQLCGDDDRAQALRETFTHMQDSDAQLDLIAHGQARLPLSSQSASPLPRQ